MMNQPTFFSAARVLPFLAMLAVVIVWSCDTYEADAIPDDKVSVGQSQFYTLPNSSTVIDLKSVVKSYAKVDLLIDKQPGQGSLTKLGTSLYAYMPRSDFRKGRDYFLLNVSRDGQTLQRDTIFIEVGQDTTQLPCGVYAVLDTVNVATTGPTAVRINVLANDRICGVDSSDLRVSLFSNPQHGSASLAGNEIVYSTPGYEGTDSFLYEINSVSDTSVHALGLVRLELGVADPDTCVFTLRNDDVQFTASIGSQIAVSVIVVTNDSICDRANSPITIVSGPLYGVFSLMNYGKLLYSKSTPFTETYSDSVKYQVCSGGVCKTAVVRLTFASDGIPCTVTAKADTVNMPLGTVPTQFSVGVLGNDNACGEVQSLVVLTAPKTGTATVLPTNRISYQPNSATSPTDSLQYQLCGTGGACAAAWVRIQRN